MRFALFVLLSCLSVCLGILKPKTFWGDVDGPELGSEDVVLKGQRSVTGILIDYPKVKINQISERFPLATDCLEASTHDFVCNLQLSNQKHISIVQYLFNLESIRSSNRWRSTRESQMAPNRCEDLQSG